MTRAGSVESRRPPVALAGWIAVVAVLGILVGVFQPTIEATLVFAIAVLLLAPIVVRIAQHEFDLFEPLFGLTFCLGVMYVLRPAAMIATPGESIFKNYVITGQLQKALVICLVAVIGFEIGYFLPTARRIAERLRPASGRWAIDLTTGFSIGLIILAVLLFSLFLRQAGGFGFLLTMMKGRNSNQESVFRNSSAYLYAAPGLLWPASLLLIAAGLAAKRRVLIWLGIVAMAALGVFAGSHGSRIVLLPLVLAPAVYAYLWFQRRPRPVAVIIVTYLVFTVGIAYFRDTRTAGSVEARSRGAELRHAVLDPSYEARQLMGGRDNDMFESLAIETLIVPSQLQPNPIDFVYRTIAKPVPSMLWKAKPIDADSHLNQLTFPNQQVASSSSTGVVGSWYLAGDLFGVFAGMLLLGIAFRVPWEYWRMYPGSSSAQLMLSVSLMYIPITLRGGISDTIARVLFGIAPLAAAVKWCRVPGTEGTHPGPE